MRKFAKYAIALAISTMFFIGFIPVSHATTTSGYAKSTNVIVLNAEGDEWGYGSSGDFPTSAATEAGYTITFLSAGSVTGVSSFGNNDTIVLWQYCEVGSDTVVQNALTSFLQNGGKIVIWDSDSCNAPDETQPDYSWLTSVGAAFSSVSPGQTGSFGGSISVVENNNFLTGISSSDLDSLVSQTDAVGDLNTVVTSSRAWCAVLNGVNIEGDQGYASAYTAPGSLSGAGGALIVYTGFDTDYIDDASSIFYPLVLNQLAHGWGNSAYTSDLACAVHVSITTVILPPPNHPCWEGACSTSFVAFNVTSAGKELNATVTFSTPHGPVKMANTLVTWTWADRTRQVQLAWFDTIVHDPVSYFVTLPIGHTVSFNVTIDHPRTLSIVNIKT